MDKVKLKYNINENLNIHIWNFEDDEKVEPPFHYQNEQPDGTPWISVEEIEDYLSRRYPAEFYEMIRI